MIKPTWTSTSSDICLMMTLTSINICRSHPMGTSYDQNDKPTLTQTHVFNFPHWARGKRGLPALIQGWSFAHYLSGMSPVKIIPLPLFIMEFFSVKLHSQKAPLSPHPHSCCTLSTHPFRTKLNHAARNVYFHLNSFHSGCCLCHLTRVIIKPSSSLQTAFRLTHALVMFLTSPDSLTSSAVFRFWLFFYSLVSIQTKVSCTLLWGLVQDRLLYFQLVLCSTSWIIIEAPCKKFIQNCVFCRFYCSRQSFSHPTTKSGFPRNVLLRMLCNFVLLRSAVICPPSVPSYLMSDSQGCFLLLVCG